MKFKVDISVMGDLQYTIGSASCEENARELAIQLFKQEYPDFDPVITWCEPEED